MVNMKAPWTERKTALVRNNADTISTPRMRRCRQPQHYGLTVRTDVFVNCLHTCH